MVMLHTEFRAAAVVMVFVACNGVAAVPVRTLNGKTEMSNLKDAIQDLYAEIRAYKESRNVDKKPSLDAATAAKARYVANSLQEIVNLSEVWSTVASNVGRQATSEVRSTVASDVGRQVSLEHKLRDKKAAVVRDLERLDLHGAAEVEQLMNRCMEIALAKDAPATKAGNAMTTVSTPSWINIDQLENRFLDALGELEKMKQSTSGWSPAPPEVDHR